MQGQSPIRRLRTALVASTLGALAGCGDGEAGRDEGSPLIVCTTTMIGDLVREVAGDDVRVEVLFGPDVDPHLYRATRDDVALLLQSDLVLVNGFLLEGHLRETLARLDDGERVIVSLCEETLGPDERIEAAEGAPDPHAWMDVSLWADVAGEIGARTAALDGLSEGAATRIAERTAALVRSLEALDAEVEETLRTVPTDGRVLVTAHDAFGYFGRRYGFEVHAIQGVSTASEAGLRAIEELVTLVVERRVPAVFFESTVSERSVRALVEGAGARGHTVTVGGTLHSDAPGRAATYVGMIRHNARTIAAALATVEDESGAAR